MTLVGSVMATMALAYDDQAIVKRCDHEWGTDFNMVKYCRDEQRKAGIRTDAIHEQAKTMPDIQIVLDRCTAEWETDYTMVVYCHDEQLNALSKLSNKPAGVPHNIYDLIGRQCEAEWSTDYVMLAYCRDQQTSAWREIQ